MKQSDSVMKTLVNFLDSNSIGISSKVINPFEGIVSVNALTLIPCTIKVYIKDLSKVSVSVNVFDTSIHYSKIEICNDSVDFVNEKIYSFLMNHFNIK